MDGVYVHILDTAYGGALIVITSFSDVPLSAQSQPRDLVRVG